MTELQFAVVIVSFCATAVTVAWTIRSKLSDIQVALELLGAKNEAEHKALDARVVKLETARAKRR